MKRDILLLDANTSILSAIKNMKRGNEHVAIVVRDKVPIGIVTNENIFDSITKDNIDLSIDKIISPLISVERSITIKEALDIMKKNNVRVLVVIDKGIVYGIITKQMISNVIGDYLNKREFSSIKPIMGNLGFILQFAGTLFVIPALLSTFLNEYIIATGIYLMIITMVTIGFFMNTYGKKSYLNIKESSILTITSFIILGLIGSIPYVYINPYNISEPIELFVDSFFTSISGFTTTGLLLFNPDNIPTSLKFYYSYTQWIGGLNFIYLIMSAFYPESRLVNMRSILTGKSLRLKELFLTIVLVFSMYTTILSSVLYLLGYDLIESLTIIMSALSTGGFLPNNTILVESNPYQLTIITIAMIVGALPFALHYTIIKGKLSYKHITKEILVYMFVIGITIMIGLTVTELDAASIIFHVISASTTTGYQFIKDIDEGFKILLIILFFIGGCTFSTAGGIKIARFITLAYMIRKKRLERNEFREFISIILLIILFPLLTYLSSLYLVNSGYTMLDSFFQSAAVITNSGFSLGLELDNIAKMILSIMMVIGRFEIIGLIYILLPKLAERH
ncbi:MAG: potassium transporter TrkG [Candidatus Nitrosocaldaceae archaeon]